MEARRNHIELGYKTYTGKCFTQQIWVDTYNRIQDRINSFIDAGAIVPENLLNESHRYFRDIATLDYHTLARKTQNNTKDYYITNDKTQEAYGRICTNLDDCRHWIINHLDMSLNWIITAPKTQLF